MEEWALGVTGAGMPRTRISAFHAAPPGSHRRSLLAVRSEVCGVGGGPAFEMLSESSLRSQPSATLTAESRLSQCGFIVVIKSYQLYIILYYGGQLRL